MAEKALLYGNPFLAALENYSTNETWTTQNNRRLDAIQSVVKTLTAADETEFAQVFLKILSGRVLVFYADQVLKDLPINPTITEISLIFRFATRANITEEDFIFILEKAALLWEEVDGEAEILFPKAPNGPVPTFDTGPTDSSESEKLAQCIDVISAMIQFLRDPGVVMIPQRYGLKIVIPSELQETVMFRQIIRESYSIIQFVQEFPGGVDGWGEMYYQIVKVIKNLNVHTKSYDTPLLDFSDQEDVDEEILFMVLEEALANTTRELKACSAKKDNELVSTAVIYESGDFDDYGSW